MILTWLLKKFDDLSARELYAILRLRNAVFVVEQTAIYQDADNKDMECYHLCGWDGENLAAYARLIPAGIAFPEASIGRVATDIRYRKMKLGKSLMQHAIEHTFAIYGVNNIRIGAQLYLQKFYTNFGFVNCSDVYIEDGIEHVEMLFVQKS